MSSKRCKEMVWNIRLRQCNNKAGPSGFCGVHSPEAAAKREAKNRQKWDKREAILRYQWAAVTYCQKLGLTLEQLEAQCPPHTLN